MRFVSSARARVVPRRIHPVACRFQQKAASLSTFRVLAHFTARVCSRACSHSRERWKNIRRRWAECAESAGCREGEGWRDLFWRLKTGSKEEKAAREWRWSGQLRHYIPNRKRDKANKTLSGRRSTNRTLWREKER